MGPVSAFLSLSLPDSGNAAPQVHEAQTSKHDMIIGTAILTLRKVGFTILGRRLLLSHSLPYRLPIQATEGQLHHPNLPPQHQLQWLHLLRHPP